MCVFMYHGLMVLQCPLALIKGSTGSFLTSTGNQSTAFVFHCNYYCSTSTGWILRQYNLTYPFVDMHDQGGGGTTDRNHLRYQVESNRISSHLIEWHDLVVLCMYLYICEYMCSSSDCPHHPILPTYFLDELSTCLVATIASSSLVRHMFDMYQIRRNTRDLLVPLEHQ